MEEDKIQKLHDSLSKLSRGKGLGVSSHYNFGGTSNKNGIPLKEGEDGKLHREDGLPANALYSNFVRQGSYVKQDSALKYGDGRAIKRNFDDCNSSDDDSTSRAKKKAKKKELKKAAKLEAKKKLKLEEKKLAKIESKKLAKLEAKKGKTLDDTVANIKKSKDSDDTPLPDNDRPNNKSKKSSKKQKKENDQKKDKKKKDKKKKDKKKSKS